MRLRVVASTIAALAWAGGLLAQGTVGPERAVTGQLVATGNASLVLRTDDGREPAPFVVTTTTQLPPGLAAGARVTVYYHAVGDRRVADRVVAGPATTPNPPQSPPAGAPGG